MTVFLTDVFLHPPSLPSESSPPARASQQPTGLPPRMRLAQCQHDFLQAEFHDHRPRPTEGPSNPKQAAAPDAPAQYILLILKVAVGLRNRRHQETRHRTREKIVSTCFCKTSSGVASLVIDIRTLETLDTHWHRRSQLLGEKRDARLLQHPSEFIKTRGPGCPRRAARALMSGTESLSMSARRDSSRTGSSR